VLIIQTTNPTGRSLREEYPGRGTAEYQQELNYTRGGIHNIPYGAVGVVTRLQNVGLCVAVYDRCNPVAPTGGAE